MGDPEVAAFVAAEAPGLIEDLVRLGAPFDRNADGTLALAREAAHTHPRIVHVSGDRAGAEITQTLLTAVVSTPSIHSLENVQALELVVSDGRVVGLFARAAPAGSYRRVLFRARAVVLATGGVGGLFATTTNPAGARGEGLGMAARAGARIADAEFVQFHPTAIHIARDPAPLATEALRGDGAVLIDENGRRFMPSVHPDAEMAPRDVVARAIHREMAHGRRVFLDCRQAIGARFSSRYPTVAQACRSFGIDPAVEAIPVSPAAHYHMGGIASDHVGRSSLDGLWCVGECAGTGLHGANRLASNSLIEALVFAVRVAKDIRGLSGAAPSRDAIPLPGPTSTHSIPGTLRRAMTNGAGLERDAEGLKATLATIARIEKSSEDDPFLLNATTAAKMIAAGALARRDSAGAHFRRDSAPSNGPHRRSFLTLAEAELIACEAKITASNAAQVPS